MYARLSAIMFPIAAIMFVGAAFWGYQEHQEKNTVLLKAENQYQRAFHDLSHHMNRLNSEMGKTLAVSVNSQGMQRKGLVNIWRMTSEAQNEINQLPLTMLPINKAESFLSRLANFAYQTSMRDLTKQPLTDQEIKTLKSLHATSTNVKRELDKVQEAVISDRLRWMDVELALANENAPQDNSIVSSFKSMDKQLGEYPENEWGPTALSTDRIRNAAALEGEQATKEDVVKKALVMLGHRNETGKTRVSENGNSTDVPTYTVVVGDGSDGDIQFDYTRKGGHLLSMMNGREVKNRKLDYDNARNKASQFLLRNNYKNMTPVAFDEYDHVAVFTFVHTINKVRIYPDKLVVRVALDNGEIVGLQASDHVFAKRVLDPGKPKMSKEQVQQGLNPQFKVKQHALAVIENGMRQLVLCHEFSGVIDDRHYRIYFNAETGEEEEIEEMPSGVQPLSK